MSLYLSSAVNLISTLKLPAEPALDVGTRGRRDSERWDASTSELGDAWGFEDVINK